MVDNETAVRELRQAFTALDYPPDFLARYDQLECLAARHGTETFLVQEKQTKRLLITRCYDSAVYQNRTESCLLQSLHHEGLPQFVEELRSERCVCIVREYVEGVPLDQYVRDKTMSRQEIVALCLRLCDILLYLHGQVPPVIHRDIKPQNLIVRPDGTPVLIDFDIARTYKPDADIDTSFFGTKGYAPPEQYGFTQTDARTDIYSFGVLLRFLLTDSARENPNVQVYKPLSDIIRKCTAFSPRERYRDMAAVKKALQHANPRAQTLLWLRRTACVLALGALLVFAGWRVYEYVTFDPFGDGHIPAALLDDERAADAVTYLQEKYGTHLFDETGEYATFGLLKQTLEEVYGMEHDFAYVGNPVDPPQESEAHFFPWTLGEEQYVDREFMAYVAVKIYWPDKVSDWSGLRDDTGQYPGVRVALKWCEETGLLTGVNRPDNITTGEAAIALANADRIFTALNEEQG